MIIQDQEGTGVKFTSVFLLFLSFFSLNDSSSYTRR
jgi:hypothetical protein